jgi:hypothetical protein
MQSIFQCDNMDQSVLEMLLNNHVNRMVLYKKMMILYLLPYIEVLHGMQLVNSKPVLHPLFIVNSLVFV